MSTACEQIANIKKNFMFIPKEYRYRYTALAYIFLVRCLHSHLIIKLLCTLTICMPLMSFPCHEVHSYYARYTPHRKKTCHILYDGVVRCIRTKTLNAMCLSFGLFIAVEFVNGKLQKPYT